VLGDIQRSVGGNLVQPRTQRAAPLKARQGPPRPEQGFLEGILSVVVGGQHPVTVGVQFRLVGFRQRPEGALITRPGQREQRFPVTAGLVAQATTLSITRQSR
jgi:hypothetical protein